MKTKKILGLLLAVAILLSIIPASLFALANGTQGVADMISAYGTKWNGFTSIAADVKDEKEADSKAIIDAYIALPDDDAKDALGINKLCNLFSIAYYYLRSVYGTSSIEGVSNSVYIDNYITANIATQKMLDAKTIARYIYGGNEFPYEKTDETAGTIKFATSTTFTDENNKKAYDDFYIYLNAIDETTKEYLTLINYSGYVFSYAPQNSLLTRAFQLHFNYLRDTNPDLTTEERAVKALQEYDALGSSFTAGFQTTLAARSAMLTYDQSGATMDVSAFTGLQAQYSALKLPVSSMLGALSSTYPLGTVNGSRALTPSNLLTIGSLGDSFATMVNTMKAYDFEQPSNQNVRLITDTYNKFNSTMQNLFKNANFLPLYETIYATYQNIARPQRDETIPGTDGYTKARMTYPTPTTKISTTFAFTSLDPLVAMIAELAIGNIGDALYTNETISTLAGLNGTIRQLLEEGAGSDWAGMQLIMTTKGAHITPANLAKALTEEQFADAKAKLSTLGTDWSLYDPADYTWGVIDGDRESFANAAVAVLRPVTYFLYTFAGIADTLDGYGDYVSDGVYETALIPFLEALGCRDIMHADDFMAEAMKLPGFVSLLNIGTRHDALGKALINPILNLIEDIVANPLPTILDILPRLAYAEQNGDLDALFHLSITVAGNVAEILPFKNLQELVNLVGGSLPVELPALDWEYLAHLGNLQPLASSNGKTVYKNFVVADRTDVFAYLVKYLGSIFDNEANVAAIGDMIFDALGVNVSTVKLIELRKACKTGDTANAAYMLIDICKDLINGVEDPAPAPCCEDNAACGCICEPGNCVAECPCACEACEPAEPAPPVEEEEGRTITFDDFFTAFVRFLKTSFKNMAQFFKDLFAGEISFV